eukprot:scaffold693_cov399-Prasinococcus_capsulatus_cf.AAC.36
MGGLVAPAFGFGGDASIAWSALVSGRVCCKASHCVASFVMVSVSVALGLSGSGTSGISPSPRPGASRSNLDCTLSPIPMKGVVK